MFDAAVSGWATRCTCSSTAGRVARRAETTQRRAYDTYPTADGGILIGVPERPRLAHAGRRRLRADPGCRPRFATNVARVGTGPPATPPSPGTPSAGTRPGSTDAWPRPGSGRPGQRHRRTRRHPQLRERDRWRTVSTRDRRVRGPPPMTFRDVRLPMGTVPRSASTPHDPRRAQARRGRPHRHRGVHPCLNRPPPSPSSPVCPAASAPPPRDAC
ncbi:hypothetical protein HBB16_10825 [Pseudonocardia sp. MCCB 268]|nr:hypothetical protein [Pseudonocardia cytotoxica]